MRVNVYAEEMTDRIEIVTKRIDGVDFTGLRLYLELPVSVPLTDREGRHLGYTQHQGPFEHRPGDDDSSAVTFWGKRDLRATLRKALATLDAHYGMDERSLNDPARWIPVSERKPRDIYTVDIWIVRGPMVFDEPYRDLGIYNPVRDKWQVHFDGDDVDVEVSHWREPPPDPVTP